MRVRVPPPAPPLNLSIDTILGFFFTLWTLKTSVIKGYLLFDAIQKTHILEPPTQKRMKNKGELPKYFVEESHTGIVDRNTWVCVQLELERQEACCREHHFWRYHHHGEENPLSSRITCSACGSTFMQLRSEKKEDEGRALPVLHQLPKSSRDSY